MTSPKIEHACRVSVIVPTYCESVNLAILIPRIIEVLDGARLTGEIIVVDDNSPDDPESACHVSNSNHPVRVIVRYDERGLSSAVIHGMRQARGEILIVMDADLSHPPEKIPDLVEAASSRQTDFVIGSRYVPGGGTDEQWGLFRWLNSKVATWLARPLTSARDPMAGFFAIKRERFLSFSGQLDPVGYKIGLELIVKCQCQKIDEVPIYFGDRQHGESKLSLKEQFNYLRHLGRLYEFKLGRMAQPIKFAMVGATGMVVDLVLFSLLLLPRTESAGGNETALISPYVARALAIWCAMSWNFFWNRKFTFSLARRRSVFHQYVLFCLSCLFGATISWSVFAWLHSSFDFFAAWPLPAAFAGIVCGFLIDFLLSKYVAFK